tara:strand:- start:1289 stop:2077 length:789 start_codon:yes stop_codon:yes gene_type:complete
MKLNSTEKWFRYLSGEDVINEKRGIDLRLYRVTLGVVVDLDKAGTDSQIENQIRGIKGVTTVAHISKAQKSVATGAKYREYEIKFEIYGAQSRDTYRDLTLVPTIAKEVYGVKVVERGRVEQIKVGLDESLWGGSAYATAYKRNMPAMPHTPALSIDSVLADWVDGAVQAYDTPMNTRDMAYHVMVPVEELWNLCGRYYRGSKQDFDGRYQHFIKNGSQQPVYVAVGRNSRIKLTGNEDDVWFAKKSGLKELPVFFSYQRQV